MSIKLSLPQQNSDIVQVEQKKAKKDKLGRAYGTGRRKNSIARVWIKAGTGKFSINSLELSEYFKRLFHQKLALLPFDATKTLGQFDVMCTVKGGGLSGQAGSIKHGIGRALSDFDPNLHLTLSHAGILTRDSRVVERKKPGKRKARRSPQFSKR